MTAGRPGNKGKERWSSGVGTKRMGEKKEQLKSLTREIYCNV